MTKKSEAERYFEKVDCSDRDGCWIWLANRDGKGYGQFWSKGRLVKAHRWSYEWFIGPLPKYEAPDWWSITFLCGNRACMNPKDLDLVKASENAMCNNLGKFGVHNSRKTHCPQGHKYDGVHSNGGRYCRSCLKVKQKEYRGRKKAGMNVKYVKKDDEKGMTLEELFNEEPEAKLIRYVKWQNSQ